MRVLIKSLSAGLLISAATILFGFNDGSRVHKIEDESILPFCHQTCPQTGSYTATLKNTSGQHVSPNQVTPSTNYIIDIDYSGAYVCCANPAYCVQTAVGFTGQMANESVNGSTTLAITTDAVLPPFGIIAVVGPTDCTGSCDSLEPTSYRVVN
jgi:hypothetical protein